MVHSLSIKHLSHSFGKRNILSDVSIELKTGEIIAVFGRNGSGKSTIFKILFGTLKPGSVEIYFDNQLLSTTHHLNTQVAYHPQEIMLPKDLRVSSLIALYSKSTEQQDKIFYAPGIHDMHDKRIYALSLGQQRYLQFLLVLNLDQPFIILDEPFSMVEPLYKNLIKEKILAYKVSKGFLITDHYYLDVLEIADKVKLLKNGKMVAIDKNEELVELEYLSEQSILI